MVVLLLDSHATTDVQTRVCIQSVNLFSNIAAAPCDRNHERQSRFNSDVVIMFILIFRIRRQRCCKKS